MGEIAVSDLTVIHNSRTGRHKEDERCRRREEKVTRNKDKTLQLCLKVTVENLDRDDVKLLRFLNLLWSLTNTFYSNSRSCASYSSVIPSRSLKVVYFKRADELQHTRAK